MLGKFNPLQILYDFVKSQIQEDSYTASVDNAALKQAHSDSLAWFAKKDLTYKNLSTYKGDVQENTNSDSNNDKQQVGASKEEELIGKLVFPDGSLDPIVVLTQGSLMKGIIFETNKGTELENIFTEYPDDICKNRKQPLASFPQEPPSLSMNETDGFQGSRVFPEITLNPEAAEWYLSTESDSNHSKMSGETF